MNKKEALAKILEIEEEELEIETFKNAWFEVDMFVDCENQYYLVLDDNEHYYNAAMYGVENMQEIGREEFYIYEIN